MVLAARESTASRLYSAKATKGPQFLEGVMPGFCPAVPAISIPPGFDLMACRGYLAILSDRWVVKFFDPRGIPRNFGRRRGKQTRAVRCWSRNGSFRRSLLQRPCRVLGTKPGSRPARPQNCGRWRPTGSQVAGAP